MIQRKVKQQTIITVLIAVFIISQFQVNILAQRQNYQNNTDDAVWTLMMYFDGDNKLETVMNTQFDLIVQEADNNDIQIVILLDGNSEDDTILYHVYENSYEELDWESESDMDDPLTLQQFIDTSRTLFPATYYGLFIGSNKGSAWQGICYDEHGDGTMITMPELSSMLHEVTDNGQLKIDLISINTCMGGNTELAYEISPFCDYYIAGPECGLSAPSQGIGFPYKESINDLTSNPSMTPYELALTCINNFNPIYEPSLLIKTTLVAVDLSQMQTLGSLYSQLGTFFINSIEDYKQEIQEALTQTKIFGESWEITYIIEPSDFLYHLEIESNEYQQMKDQILSLIETGTIAKKIVQGDIVYGFNLYFPRSTPDYNHALRYESGILPSPYEETQFAKDTSWDEFLKTLLGIAYNTAPNTPTIIGPTEGIIGESMDYIISSIDPDGDDVYYSINWGDGNVNEWIGPYASGVEITQSHIWDNEGIIEIQVKSKDENDAESLLTSHTVSLPKSKNNNGIKTILLGTIDDIEENSQGGIRFLPLRLLTIVIGGEYGFLIQIIDASHGGYPCCTYMYPQDFKGFIGSSFICGIWFT